MGTHSEISSESFHNVCIEEKYKHSNLNECDFDSCYIETAETTFKQCHFEDSYIFVPEHFFKDCSFSNCVTPLFTGDRGGSSWEHV